jgi:hypothetical protein
MNQKAFPQIPAERLAEWFRDRIARVFLHTARDANRVESQGTAGGGREPKGKLTKCRQNLPCPRTVAITWFRS